MAAHQCKQCDASFDTMTDHNIHVEKRHPVVPVKPRIEVVRQNDGRDLLLYDGVVVGLIEQQSDDTRPTLDPDQDRRHVTMRIRQISAPQLYANIGISGIRFDTEAEYDAWINDEHPEDA